jgi:hypothetical protein
MSSLAGSRTPAGAASAGMRFSVDPWDVSYGTAMAVEEMRESAARVNTDIEVAADRWAPVGVRDDPPQPSAVLFVDGVRRIDARVWIDDPPAPATGSVGPTARLTGAATASMAVCASYAAGVVCCCGGTGPRQSHILATKVRRGLFTTAAHAIDIPTTAGTYRARHTMESTTVPLTMTLSNALQQALGEIEVATAVEARAALPGAPEHEHTGVGGEDGDLLVIDGPLRNRAHLPRALGLIKTHHTEYLPPTLDAVVASLTAGERTPVFLMGTSWERHAWYLRLPCTPDTPGAPWAGVVRCEAATDLSLSQLTALANLSQAVLCRYASVAYKDSRAPQNLVPIAGLEHTLRHRLGDTRLMYRALQGAARQ